MAFLGSEQFKGPATRLNAAGDRLFATMGRRVGKKGGLAKAIPAIEVVLLCAIAAVAALILLKLIAPLPVPEKFPAPQRVQISAPQTDGAINPFGAVPDDFGGPLTELEVGPDLEETQLDLVLHGVWLTQEGGSAIIKTPDDKQGRFGLGDEIWDEVTLDRVYRDQVTIMRGGVRESLRLINSKPASPPPLREESADRRPQAPRSPVSQAGVGLIGESVMVVQENIGEGESQFVLQPTADDAAFRALGFEAGDVLVGVDEVWLGTDSALAIMSLAEVMDRSSVEVKVERDGVVVPLTISLAGDGESVDDDDD